MPTFEKLQQDITTDVLIIGGGIAGILCAHKLASAGIDYTLIEADRICCGITGNTTAKITAQHGLIYRKLLRMHGPETTKAYYQANMEAVQELIRLSQTAKCDSEPQDSFLFSRHNRALLEEEKAALDRLDIPSDLVTDTDLPFSVAGAIRFSNQAQCNPLKLLAVLAQGMNIYENTTAQEWTGNTVATDGGRINASKIIVATHFPMFNKHGAYFLKLYQQRSYVLALESRNKINGMYLEAEPNGLSLRTYGNLLLIGGGGHRTGKPSDGWKPLEVFAKEYDPHGAEICRWATQDCISLDGMPYIGQYSPATPNLFVATGFHKWGMSNSMVAASLLCDLVQGKENPYARMFSPARNPLRWQLVKNISHAVINLMQPTTPICPHMGCALKWNRQEHSWDCPCHGSRFSEDGTLLDNPATKNLKRKT